MVIKHTSIRKVSWAAWRFVAVCGVPLQLQAESLLDVLAILLHMCYVLNFENQCVFWWFDVKVTWRGADTSFLPASGSVLIALWQSILERGLVSRCDSVDPLFKLISYCRSPSEHLMTDGCQLSAIFQMALFPLHLCPKDPDFVSVKVIWGPLLDPPCICLQSKPMYSFSGNPERTCESLLI